MPEQLLVPGLEDAPHRMLGVAGPPHLLPEPIAKEPDMAEQRQFYVVVCLDCNPAGDLQMPFTDPGEGAKWATAHREGTGHDHWIVNAMPGEWRPETSDARAA